jgi:hypothetical protein
MATVTMIAAGRTNMTRVKRSGMRVPFFQGALNLTTPDLGR